MWPCKDIDFSWSDIRFAVCACITTYIAKGEKQRLAIENKHNRLICLSVRAAFDLYLTAREWTYGDECIFIGVNVPDMFRIAASHGLLVRGTDIDPISTQPILSQLRANINPRTRFVVVPHLFGHRLDLHAVIELADAYGIDVIEDCAQAFAGNSWWGTDGATLSLFSFGPLKTATALQGAVVIVRDTVLLETMKRKLASYPVQSTWRYFLRVLRFTALKITMRPLIYGLLVRTIRLLGINHEFVVHSSTKSTPINELERWSLLRPSNALMSVIERKISNSDASFQLRIAKGSSLVVKIAKDIPLVLRDQRPNVFWMVPLLVSDAARFKHELRRKGFDALSARLEAVECVRMPGAKALANAVMLPFSPAMPNSEIQRLQNLVMDLFTSTD